MNNSIPFICSLQLLFLVIHTDAIWGPMPWKSKCKADAGEPWTYRGRNGPRFWGQNYTGCNGQEQSPINIVTDDVVEDDDLERLNFNNYDMPIMSGTLENNGHTINVIPTDNVERSIDVEGVTYSLQQLHFHWGDASCRGAEHTIDGVQYSMEMHLVHRNEDGDIAVVGVLYQESKEPTEELQNITDRFPYVQYKDNTTTLEAEVNLTKLLPNIPNSFYRYDGSLTTPECTEDVIWSVLTEILPVGKNQMTKFRSLFSATKSEATPSCTLSNNYRPIQPTNDREVSLSQ